MYLGRVVGCVWSTVKNRSLEGHRLLLVQPLTPEFARTGKRIVCTDCTSAGAGELVYWVRGKEAIFALAPDQPPVDTTIVGIVDAIHLQRAPAPAPPAAPRAGRKPRKG
jgi:ethanolamine utilization protein EutN